MQYILNLQGKKLDTVQASKVFGAFELSAVQHTLCRKLSQGQRRKVAIVATLLAQQPLWFLDEPFNVLDKQGTQQLVLAIQKHIERDHLVVLSSHQAVASSFKPIELEALRAS